MTVNEDDREVWFDDNGAEVYYYNNAPFTGESEEFNKSGHLISKAQFQEGYITGPVKIWYSNGQIQCESNYLYSLKHGKRIEWFENGNLKKEEVFEMGALLMEQEFDETGTQIKDYDVERDNPKMYQHILDWREIRAKYANQEKVE